MLYEFENGFQFITNPGYPTFIWTSDGYLDTPDARKLFRKMLDEGHTYVSKTVKQFGFEIVEATPEPSVNDLGWRDMYSACK